MKIISIFLIALLISFFSFGQDITGDWNGLLNVQGMQLRIVFHITYVDGKYHATVDSPDQNSKGISVNSVNYDPPALSMDIAVIGANYKGDYDQQGNTIKGIFSQSGQVFPLDLSREALQKKALYRPQEPKEPYPYLSENVNFLSENGKINLSGTLTLPNNKGKFSVVILISGSGPQNRDEEIMTHKPFLVLADHLTRHGIAVLRYDDRGVAQSTGNHESANTRDFANDVKSAIEYLKKRKEIDQNQIGLIGHSEGGLIASMIAAESKDVDFIALLASPGISGEKISMQQIKTLSRMAGRNEDDIQKAVYINQSVIDLVKKIENTDTLKQKLESFFDGLPEKDLQIPAGVGKVEYIKMFITQLIRPWTRYYLTYDPTEALKHVQCPVLAINGEKDVQVIPENLSYIRKALQAGGNENVKIREYPGLNHLFQECNTGAITEYAVIEQTISPAVLEDITTWILAQER